MVYLTDLNGVSYCFMVFSMALNGYLMGFHGELVFDDSLRGFNVI